MSISAETARVLRQPSVPTLRHADIVGSLLAMVLLAISTGASIMEQAAVEKEYAQPAAANATAGIRAGTAASEMLIAAYGGAPYTYPGDVAVKKTGQHDFTVKHVGWDGLPFEDPIYYGARVARWSANGRTGTMVDFTHSKAISRLADELAFSGTYNNAPIEARKKLGDVFKRLEFSHGHNMLTFNGLMRLPSLVARLSPYVGAGAGVSLPHTEIQLASDNARTYEYQIAGPVAQALVGIEFKLSRVSFFVEYKLSIARNQVPLSQLGGSILPFDIARQIASWFGGGEPPSGSLLTILTSHQVISGFGVRFSAAPAAVP